MSNLQMRSKRSLGIILLAISSVVLASALFIDLFLGFDPCILCIYERVPYVFIMFFSIILIFNHLYIRSLLLIIAFITLIGGSLAIYHVGIERNLWKATSQCSQSFDMNEYATLEDFKKHLDTARIGDCSKPALRILGLSLAEINVIMNMLLLIFTLLSFRKL